MIRQNTAAALLAAAMLVLAGCSGAVPGGDGGGAATTDDGTGTVTLYVSDQPGAMGDFEHLNVTIDRVAYHQVNASGSAPDDAPAGNETDTNVTDADDEAEADAEERDDGGDGAEDEKGPGWHTYDVENRTVDLTELQGENATAVGQQRLPNGTYDKVFLYVSETNGTLTDGSSTRVKLPSGKLQLTEQFTVGNNESVDFVFDATVVKAGNSGKYVLTPVVSESGTDVPIKEVAEDEDSGLGARFVGSVDRGAAATVKVTQRGQPVAGATVETDEGEYTTAGDGTVTFDVPADAEAVEVEVAYEDGEVELTRTFPKAADEADGGDAGGQDSSGDDGADDSEGGDADDGGDDDGRPDDAGADRSDN
jgi:hypothetical protein